MNAPRPAFHLMSAPPRAAACTVDAALVLEATAATLARLFTAHRVADGPDRAAALAALQRALETRWRLETEVLLPALRDAWDGACSICDGREIGGLRALAALLAPDAAAYDERQTALLTLLEAAATQRIERVAAIVEFTRRDARLDLMALGRALVLALEARGMPRQRG